jgi:cytoskeletal protein CcmA (bactofilin family)
MALWKDPTKDTAMANSEAGAALAPDPIVRPAVTPSSIPTTSPEPMRRAPAASGGPAKESLIAADVTIEGKIEGAGHVRIAGRFKGDVNVQGNVTIEQGAFVTGQISAATVIVSGEINGNIVASARVELLETGVISGDVKAAILTVAAGSRMRGNADFGWPEQGKK